MGDNRLEVLRIEGMMPGIRRMSRQVMWHSMRHNFGSAKRLPRRSSVKRCSGESRWMNRHENEEEGICTLSGEDL